MSPSPAKSSPVRVGGHAPDFTLLNQDGIPVHFADLLGKGPIVLYFYPKDYTSGCTAEACSFRDSYQVFRDAGATVIGVSDDSVASHMGFAERNRLPFTLLSDPGGKVRTLFGVSRLLGIIPGRVTFVIDRDGMVRLVFSNYIAMSSHVKQALKIVESLT
jgi:peroxiredoxin Q/BCP